MKHLGDITKINGAEIEIVDVITGGSPCQDLSIAGKRTGLAGARSGLFMEQTRIVKEMREHDRKSGRTGDMVRPRFMVWENVPGAFSSNKGQDFAAVLEEIIRIAEPEAPDIEVPEKGWNTWGGYHDEVGGRWSVAWRVHDAQYWGVPQRRRRISIVADFGGDTAGEILFERKSVSGHPAESGTAGERLAGNAESGASYAVRIRGGCDGGGKGALVQEDKSGTLGTGNDQTIFCLQGNGIDRADTAGCNGKGWREDTSYTLNTIDRPAVCAGVRCLTPWEAQSARVYDQDGAWHSLNANENGGMARDSVLCAGFKAGQGAQAGGIGYSEEVSPTLTAAPSGTNQTPAVVALDMSHACDVIRDCGEIAPSLQARMGTGGNQVPLTYQDVTGTLSPGAHSGSYNGQDAYNDMLVCGATPEVAHALRAKASCAYREDAETYPVQNMVVRRLTPMECERLQGYPDGWTDIGEWMDSKGKRHKDADSPRYKALGNSIALPFWDFLAKRISAQYLRPVTMGSLFDGIGGFPLVFELHNGKGAARWASEIEEFPIAVTKLRFGED
uniref:DNA cytosine methyltransferase n=1 Tax=Faecalibacterium prausnitzii TaxID=853 RepID=UPI0040265F54